MSDGFWWIIHVARDHYCFKLFFLSLRPVSETSGAEWEIDLVGGSRAVNRILLTLARLADEPRWRAGNGRKTDSAGAKRQQLLRDDGRARARAENPSRRRQGEKKTFSLSPIRFSFFPNLPAVATVDNRRRSRHLFNGNPNAIAAICDDAGAAAGRRRRDEGRARVQSATAPRPKPYHTQHAHTRSHGVIQLRTYVHTRT